MHGAVAADQAGGLFQQTWEPFLSKLGTPVTPDLLQIGEWPGQHLDRLAAYLYQEPPSTLSLPIVRDEPYYDPP